MTNLGFKEITPQNWVEPDEASTLFAKLSPDGQIHILTGTDYLKNILSPKLLASVPQDVRALFEVARGAMVYGYFFYPLYTLAMQQLYRVAEAAASHKCTEFGTLKSAMTFKERIEWLVDKRIIPRSEFGQWDAERELRNISSHPTSQSIVTPGNAIGMLQDVASQINSLFNSKAMNSEPN